jgi:hypothetical protein
LLVVALQVAWLWDVLAGDATLFTRDVLIFLIPFKSEAGRLLASGHAPWLSERLMGGMPLWGHPSAEVVDPATLLFAWLEDQPWRAFGLAVVFHGTLAAMGAYALARVLGLRVGLATVVAVAYLGCGPVASAWTIKSMATVSLPWMLTGAALLARGSAPWGAALLALGSAVACLHPDPPAVASAGGLALLTVWHRARRSTRAIALLRACVSGGLGVLCCAVFLWPAWQVISASTRATQSQWAVSTTLGWRWVEFFAPNPLGVPGATGSLMGAMGRLTSSLPYVGSLYLGASGWLGLLTRGKKKLERAYLGAAALLVLAAHGDAIPGTAPLWSLVHARFPDKLLLPAYLLVIVAAAKGIQRVMHRRDRHATGPFAAAAGVALLGMAAAVPLSTLLLNALPGEPTPHHGLDIEFCSEQLRLGLSLLAVSAVTAALLVPRGNARLAIPVWLLLACLEAALGSTTALPTGRLDAMVAGGVFGAAALPKGTRLATGDSQHLFARMPSRTTPELPPSTASFEAFRRLEPSTGTLLGFSYPVSPDVGGFDHLLTAMALYTWMPRLNPDAALKVLRVWGVDVLLSHAETPGDGVTIQRLDRGMQGGMVLHHFVNAPPPTTVHAAWESVASGEQAVLRVSQGAPGPVVVGPRQGGAPAADTMPRLAVEEHRDGVLRARVTSTTESLLVHRVTLKKGWEATVDGTTVQPWLVNALHLGVVVPAGEHTVALRYSPPGLMAGAVVSALAWLVLGAWCVALRRKRAVD